jgi:hypothetical protein
MLIREERSYFIRPLNPSTAAAENGCEMGTVF